MRTAPANPLGMTSICGDLDPDPESATGLLIAEWRTPRLSFVWGSAMLGEWRTAPFGNLSTRSKKRMN